MINKDNNTSMFLYFIFKFLIIKMNILLYIYYGLNLKLFVTQTDNILNTFSFSCFNISIIQNFKTWFGESLALFPG